MKKRLTSIMLCFVTIAAMLSTVAYAAEPVTPGKALVYQDYDSDSSTILTSNLGGLLITKVTEDGNTYAEVKADSDKPFCRFNLAESVSEDFVVTVDLCKMESPSLGWQFQIYTASKAQVRWAFDANAMEVGTWYTYLSIRKDGVIKHYRKVRGSDEAFEPISASGVMQISDGANAFIVSCWTAYGAEANGSYTSTRFLADNIVFYNGTFVVPGTQKIEVADTEDGKKITASTDVYSDAALEEKLTVAPVMVVFDKKGKIMEWSPSTAEVCTSRSTVATELTVSDEYYEKIRGGKAELYLWTTETSFKPMMNGYRVTLD